MKLPLEPHDIEKIEANVGDAAERWIPNLLVGIVVLAVVAAPVLFIVGSCG